MFFNILKFTDERCIRKKWLYLQHLTDFNFFFPQTVLILARLPAVGLCKEQCCLVVAEAYKWYIGQKWKSGVLFAW